MSGHMCWRPRLPICQSRCARSALTRRYRHPGTDIPGTASSSRFSSGEDIFHRPPSRTSARRQCCRGVTGRTDDAGRVQAPAHHHPWVTSNAFRPWWPAVGVIASLKIGVARLRLPDGGAGVAHGHGIRAEALGHPCRRQWPEEGPRRCHFVTFSVEFIQEDDIDDSRKVVGGCPPARGPLRAALRRRDWLARLHVRPRT